MLFLSPLCPAALGPCVGGHQGTECPWASRCRFWRVGLRLRRWAGTDATPPGSLTLRRFRRWPVPGCCFFGNPASVPFLGPRPVRAPLVWATRAVGRAESVSSGAAAAQDRRRHLTWRRARLQDRHLLHGMAAVPRVGQPGPRQRRQTPQAHRDVPRHKADTPASRGRERERQVPARGERHSVERARRK